TVFAPTDDAFAALPEGTVEALLEDPEGALTQILTYHVVDGAVFAADVVGLSAAPTLQGEEIAISVDGESVMLNETVNVVSTDIAASNGVVHVIDAVLIPPSIAEAAAEEEPMADLPSIAEVAVGAGTFNTLVAALDAAGLTETLAGEGAFTVFAPTDDAFAALPEGTVEALLEDPEGALTDILLYHVVDGVVPAETVVTLEAATTLNNKDVTIEVVDEGVVLNGTVNVVTTDIEASNGIVHVIDAVLLPPESFTIIDAAASDSSFTTLVAAIEAAGLTETLSGPGPFTVFAPTDDAFAALPEGTVESLLEDPTGALTNILTYHVVSGAVPASAVVTLESAPTLLGQDVTITVDDDGNVFLNETVQVIITDLETDNGIIHVIDAVLIPAE
ncbi:MAG: fasciclin domain-containing protein, partial [Chloroflexota bacterium]